LTFDKTVYIYLDEERYLLALSVHTMTVYYVYCVSPNLHCKTIRVIAKVRAPETRSSFTKYQSSFFLTLRRLDTALADDANSVLNIHEMRLIFFFRAIFGSRFAFFSLSRKLSLYFPKCRVKKAGISIMRRDYFRKEHDQYFSITLKKNDNIIRMMIDPTRNGKVP